MARLNHKDVAEYLIAEGLHLTALELHAELVDSGKELKVLKDFFSDPLSTQIHGLPGAVQEDALLPPSTSELYRSTPNPSPGGNAFSQYAGNKGGTASYFDITRSGSQMTLDSIDRITRYSEDTDRREEDRLAVLEYELRTSRDIIVQLRSSLAHFTSEERRRTLSEPPVVQQENDEPIEDIPLRPHEQKMINYLINDYLLRNGYKFTAVTFSDECNEEDFDDWEELQPTSLINLFRSGGQPKPPVSREEDQEDLNNSSSEELALLEVKGRLELAEAGLSEAEARNLELEAALSDRLADKQQLTEEVDILSAARLDLEARIQEQEASISSLQSLISSLEAAKTELEDRLRTAGHRPEAGVDTVQLEHEREDGDGASVADDRPPTPPSESDYVEAASSKVGVELERYLQREAGVELVARNPVEPDIIHILAERLPTIVSSLVLAVRVEVIPLILHVVHKHQESKVRDDLIGLLFNLLKRPESSSREKILSGLVWVCSQQDWTVSRTEEEILPHLWQQIENKYSERRQLVAEAVGLLCSCVSQEMRSSLLFSLMEQLIRDPEIEVVQCTIRSLAILSLSIDMPSRLGKLREMVLDSLQRHSNQPTILQALVRTVVPALVVTMCQDDIEFCFELLEQMVDTLATLNCQMEVRVDMLDKLLPLIAYMMTVKSTFSANIKSMDLGEKLENPTLREMFGEGVEQKWFNWIQSSTLDSHLSNKTQHLLHKFCDAVRELDATQANPQLGTKDNQARRGLEFLKNCEYYLGAEFTRRAIVDRLVEEVEEDSVHSGAGFSIVIQHLVTQEERVGGDLFQLFFIRNLHRLSQADIGSFRSKLTCWVRAVSSSGGLDLLVDVIEKNIEQNRTSFLEVLAAVAEYPLDAGSIDRVLALEEPVLRELHNNSVTTDESADDNVDLMLACSSLLSILCKQALNEEQQDQLMRQLDGLLLDNFSCRHLLNAAAAILESSKLSCDIILPKLCALPLRWSRLVPLFEDRGLCLAFIKALSNVPRLEVQESMLSETVLPSLAQLLETIQANHKLQAAAQLPQASSCRQPHDSCLETDLLMLMSEVEAARRSSFVQQRPQHQQQQQQLTQQKYQQLEMTEGEADPQQDRVERVNVKEKMQKLFQKPGARISIFKK